MRIDHEQDEMQYLLHRNGIRLAEFMLAILHTPICVPTAEIGITGPANRSGPVLEIGRGRTVIAKAG